MLCDNCGENQANIKYTQVINGQKKQTHLCEKCSEKLRIKDISFNLPINFSDFLGDFLTDYNSNTLLPSFEKKEELKCNKCGLTYDEFINLGKFGCSDCYNYFSEKMDFILKKLHGSNIHTGKKLNQKIKSTKINVKNKIENDVKETNENNMLKLQKDLNIAIKEERYEDAAIIRDEIKKIEKGGKK